MECRILIPQQIILSDDDYSSLEAMLVSWSVKNILLVTDKNIYCLGLCNAMISRMEKRGIAVKLISSCPPEPSVDAVDSILEEVKGYNADCAIGVGGGSVLDITKLICTLIGTNLKVRQLISDPSLAKKRIHSVAIPTTCGTGSEATYNAIVAISEKSTKFGIVSQSFLMDAVILNVSMIANLPKKLIASTGIDALAHVVECYTGNKANIISDLFAMEGAKLIFNNIEKAYSNPCDISAKKKMLLGAFYGGLAISGSGTTAVHALSYPLGGKFHIPHGVSNAIMFVPVMKFNESAIVSRLAELYDGAMYGKEKKTDKEKADAVVSRIAEIVKNTEIPVSLNSFGVKKSDLEFLVESSFQQKRLLNNNKKDLSIEDIRCIYEQVLSD